jgi:hypothetical protein
MRGSKSSGRGRGVVSARIPYMSVLLDLLVVLSLILNVYSLYASDSITRELDVLGHELTVLNQSMERHQAATSNAYSTSDAAFAQPPTAACRGSAGIP